jgi:uncharacterized protein DUF2213
MPDRTHVHAQRGKIEGAAATAIRRELYNGKMHSVFPAVLAVEGVLNEALVTADELAKYVEAWNGRPIPILHPQEDGNYVSANYPDILERVAGTVFGATRDGDKLRAEFWLDEQRMDELGQAPLLGAMREGKTVEVSTGYFSDSVVEHGEVGGKKYSVRHVNIRPDHVALLPGMVGACSIADGCGAPRVNVNERKTIATALAGVMRALGLKANECNCEEPPMSKVKEIAAGIVAMVAALPAGTEPKVNLDVADLEKMSEAGLAGLAAYIKAVQKGMAPPDEDEAAKAKAKANAAAAAAVEKPITLGQLKDLVANTVKDAVASALSGDAITATVERGNVKARLLANSACAFTAAELDAMPFEALAKYEKSIRPADYSGAGGFHTAANGSDEVEMPFRGGVLATLREQAAAKKQ